MHCENNYAKIGYGWVKGEITISMFLFASVASEVESGNFCFKPYLYTDALLNERKSGVNQMYTKHSSDFYSSLQQTACFLSCYW